MTHSHRLMALVFALLALTPAMARAQDGASYQYSPDAGAPPQGAQVQFPPDASPPPQGAPVSAQPSYSPQQVQQLVAPIALYPDSLLGQVLMASTYPLEIVEASRWRQDPNNANLQGDQLASALEQQSWDPSVKSLVAFPQVLSMMDGNLQWTEQLGDAFLAQQADVSQAVQGLRGRAQQAGHLTSTPQQTVTAQQGAIVIQPAQPEVVYVPVYNPQVVYGAWPYAAYPPYYFPPPPNYYYAAPGIIGFGIGIAVGDLFWGWDRWDWHSHRILIDDRRFAEINRGRPPINAGFWEHNPYHRHGVPYSSPGVRTHFEAEAQAERRNFRGFDPARARNVTPAASNALARSNVRPQTGAVPNARNANNRGDNFQHMGNAPRVQTQSAAPQVRAEPQVQQQSHAADRVRQQVQPQAQQHQQFQPQVQHQQVQQQQRSSPVFESFSRGSDVRAQSQRGAFSRSTRVAPQVTHASAPQQHQQQPQHQEAPRAAAPSGGGGGGGHGGGDHDDHGKNH